MSIQPTQMTSVIVKGCLVRLLAEPSDDRFFPMTDDFDAKSFLIPNLDFGAVMQLLRFYSIGSPSALLYSSSFWINNLDPPMG